MTTGPPQRFSRSVTALDNCRRSLRAASRALALALAREENAREAAKLARDDLAAAMKQNEEFVGVMVHDALTDLTVIKGWAQILQRRLWIYRSAETASLAAMAEKIDQLATRMAAELRMLDTQQTGDPSQGEQEDRPSDERPTRPDLPQA